MTMKLVKTGREYGDKKEEARQRIKFEGVSLTIIAKDFWQGPIEAGDKGHWERGYYVEPED